MRTARSAGHMLRAARLQVPAAVAALMLLAAACTGGSPSPASPSEGSAGSASSSPGAALPQAERVDWATFGFDLGRTGSNPKETVLTTSNAAKLRESWSTELDGPLTASPVLAAGVSVGGSTRDLLIVGSEEGTVYALDVENGHVVWGRDVEGVDTPCLEFPGGRHGVSGSAAIDRSTNRLYVAGGTGKAWALDLSTGRPEPGWPVTITEKPEREHVYGAVTLSRGLLYVATAGPCEPVPFHGALVAVDTRTRRRVASFYPTGADGPSGGGIWGPGGVSVDGPSGDVFVAVGNARTHPESFGYSEQVVRLTARLKVKAANYPGLTGVDSDFGSTPMLFRPPGCPPELIALNKAGEMFLYDQRAIGKGPIQRIQIADANLEQLMGLPAWSPQTEMVYVTNPSDSSGGPYRHGMVAFRVGVDCRLTMAWQRTAGPNQVIVSPPTVAGGVVYYADGNGRRVFAFDAATGEPLWDTGRRIGGKVFAPPVVVNGRCYVVSWDNRVYAFEP